MQKAMSLFMSSITSRKDMTNIMDNQGNIINYYVLNFIRSCSLIYTKIKNILLFRTILLKLINYENLR